MRKQRMAGELPQRLQQAAGKKRVPGAGSEPSSYGRDMPNKGSRIGAPSDKGSSPRAAEQPKGAYRPGAPKERKGGVAPAPTSSRAGKGGSNQ